MSTNEPQVGIVRGEPIAQGGARVLTGWLGEDEAIRLLLGGRVPGPGEDMSGPRARARTAREHVERRPAFTGETAIVPTDDRAALDQVAARPEVQAAFSAQVWRPDMIDLRRVQTIQKLIRTDGLDARIAPVVDDTVPPMEFCLPTEQPEPPAGAFTDQDGKGLTIASANPNLRVAGANASRGEVSLAPGAPTVPMMAVAIFVFFGTSYLTVASYRDRYFLRDGNHRASALLRAGIHIVPAIVVEAANFEQVAPLPGAFTYETCYSDRPPLLTDFWDDDVADEVLQPVVRKVIRVRGDEFLVQG